MNPERFLVDTTVWVKYLRGLDPSVKERLAPLVLEEKVFITEIIIMEILRGSKSDREYSMLYQDFSAIPLLEINKGVWELAWRSAYKLRRSGINVPLADVLIASVAMYSKCVLLHSDRHFGIISKQLGLRAEEL